MSSSLNSAMSTPNLAFDARSLDALRGRAAADPRGAGTRVPRRSARRVARA
jgi:hypothetical protein